MHITRLLEHIAKIATCDLSEIDLKALYKSVIIIIDDHYVQTLNIGLCTVVHYLQTYYLYRIYTSACN